VKAKLKIGSAKVLANPPTDINNNDSTEQTTTGDITIDLKKGGKVEGRLTINIHRFFNVK
jgi:hypothetical protein